jgi:hypothetical protein
MYPLSDEALFLVLLDVDSSALASVALDDALLEITGVDYALGLLPVAMCMAMGQNSRRSVWGPRGGPEVM